ncbi:litaf-like zinc ribbon domain-containing [Trichoderma arundinaceum]|uniref:Litaf-like zinc ribbon domain-containing n=1 Tax=Trichoderma arundinaceum TaxID=490622 RepID=A0A395NYE6_TRIAR|nr:litaf-like zinc ribbon domain-containing [Trichoderma arundinaceum]
MSQSPQDTGLSTKSVPLENLQPSPEWVNCPNCKQHAQTSVQGRTEGMRKFMNVFWWPLPNREHWFEETKWFCSNCNKQLAIQKHGKNLQVLV